MYNEFTATYIFSSCLEVFRRQGFQSLKNFGVLLWGERPPLVGEHNRRHGRLVKTQAFVIIISETGSRLGIRPVRVSDCVRSRPLSNPE